MTGKLMFVPDTHVVVPREPTDEMVNASWMCQGVTSFDSDGIQKAISIAWHAMVKKAPQLTTPPVLRWEGGKLKVFGIELATVLYIGGGEYEISISPVVYESLYEARRAAEKALGILFEVEEV